MKCERCGKELSDSDLYCSRCGKAVFPEYMDEEDIWAYYKSDEELEQILKAEEGQAGESQEEGSEEEAGEPEASETGTPLPEEAPIENSQPEILEAEPRELEAVRPEITAEDPETAFEPVIPEENPSEKDPENPGKLEQPEEQKAPEKQEYPEEISGEEEPKEGEGPEESEKESRSGEVQSLDAEDIGEADEDLDEEDGNEEEKEPLTPEKKRARRYTALLAGIFLLLCLAAGIFLGIRRMNQLDALEKEYDQRIEESETETSSADTGNIRLLVEEPDLSQNTKLQPVSAQADSQKQSEEEDYSGSSLIDGDQATSWQEGEEGTGEGKGATLTLDGSHQIRYLVLYLGNWKSDELWSYNARPQSLAIQVGENDEEILEFPDEKQVFYLALQEPVEASEIKIRIQSSYEGERWEDNCISEIEVYE